MLVLSRRSQESVVVGGADGFEKLLKVTVLAIIGNKVRLGFELPDEIPVHRLEVWERIQASARIGNSAGSPEGEDGDPNLQKKPSSSQPG
jgi:carbon storage regulator